MEGWLVNDKLTCIPGTRTLWHMLLDGIPGLVDMTTGSYVDLASRIEDAAFIHTPDYIIRNATYFRSLDLPVKTISFVQDSCYGWTRELQLNTCLRSDLVVFNSEYTKLMYSELNYVESKIIPVGTDFETFKPSERTQSVPAGSVLFVGSTNPIKGWNLLKNIVLGSKRHFVLVLKDDADVDLPRTTILRRIQQDELARVASSCSVGICTSISETQHLAGIEMGACGLPLVSTPVGIYYGLEDGEWGRTIPGSASVQNWIEGIDKLSDEDRSRDRVREFWLSKGLDERGCVNRWKDAITIATRNRKDSRQLAS